MLTCHVGELETSEGYLHHIQHLVVEEMNPTRVGVLSLIHWNIPRMTLPYSSLHKLHHNC